MDIRNEFRLGSVRNGTVGMAAHVGRDRREVDDGLDCEV
jgi:hypothetical protein